LLAFGECGTSTCGAGKVAGKEGGIGVMNKIGEFSFKGWHWRGSNYIKW
jgi:hypothetical protein